MRMGGKCVRASHCRYQIPKQIGDPEALRLKKKELMGKEGKSGCPC